MQRALKVVRYLREDGWQPVVLTANPQAYARTHPGQLGEIPSDVPVHRAFALDATRHLSIRGRYPGCFSWPDPWISWYPAALWSGRRLIRRYRPAVIWSTFPIATANLVALQLTKWSGVPWIADLRDPMTMNSYPPDRMRFRFTRWIEQRTVEFASNIVFTAEHTRKMYEARYPSLNSKSVLIPNGYDETNFPHGAAPARMQAGEQVTLLHSGSLQPVGRNPHKFFQAIKQLKETRGIGSSGLRIVFRGSGFEGQYRIAAGEAGVADMVEFADYLPYEQAIEEMVRADGLLMFQGAVYNHAIPAKFYEYLYARRPLFALVDKDGETRRVLDELGIESVASIDSVDEIAERLEVFISAVRNGEYALPPEAAIEAYSRRRQTLRLSGLLESAAAVGSSFGAS